MWYWNDKNQTCVFLCLHCKNWIRGFPNIFAHDGTGMLPSCRRLRIKLNGKCQRGSHKICIDKVWAEGYFKALLYDVLRCDAEMASGYSLWCQERILMEWRLSSMATDSRRVSSAAPGIEHLRFWCNFNPQIFVGIHPEAQPRATVGHHVSIGIY